MEDGPKLLRRHASLRRDLSNWWSGSRRMKAAGSRKQPTSGDERRSQPQRQYPIAKKLQRLWWRVAMKKEDWGARAKAVPYDSYAYSLNFDEGGLVEEEPDSLARSFSARFAVVPPAGAWWGEPTGDSARFYSARFAGDSSRVYVLEVSS